MYSFSRRDLAVVGLIVASTGVTVLFALVGWSGGALATLGVLIGLVGVVSRVQFASRRAALQTQRSNGRAVRQAAELTLTAVSELANDISELRREIGYTQSQISGVEAGVTGAQRDAAQELGATRRRLVREVTAAREDLSDVKSALARQRKHLQPDLLTDVQALTQLMARYAPTAPLPPLAGWALSPAGLLYLADAIERRQADLVVECGSGTSTLWMAFAMRRRGTGKVLALEHQEHYAEQTRAVLAAHGVSEWAEVRVCPLVSTPTPRGDFRWYDLDVTSIDQPIDVLLVDGPPGSTGRHARYPALPRLAPLLAENSLIVFDDADRVDERDVLTFWADEVPGLVPLASPGRGVEVMQTSRA